MLPIDDTAGGVGAPHGAERPDDGWSGELSPEADEQLSQLHDSTLPTEILPCVRAGRQGEPHRGLGLGPGKRIHQYELVRELGRGSMGRVFLARDSRLHREVAIKLLICDQAGFAQRFIIEARTTARCQHPNIVIIHDVNEHQGFPYMVLEYLQGQSLKELMTARGPLPPAEVVDLMRPVVQALICAHDFGIVHRDLKPANVFVTNRGVIKVLDFGIAKLLGEPVERAAAETAVAEVVALAELAGEPELTAHGVILGTMPYMAPEQWRAESIDHRVDIWAMGIMLYELITGRHPLGRMDLENLRQIAHEDQPIPSLGACVGVPGALVDVVDRCLKKRREQRIASAAELLALLESAVPRSPGQGQEVTYDPRLIPMLKSDHDDILQLYGCVAERVDRREWGEIPTLLTRLKARLSTHLLTENTRFYRYLQQSLAGDPDNCELIRDFYREMSDLAKEVVAYVGEYQRAPVCDENADVFCEKFRQVGELLRERIEREERELYSLYTDAAL